MLLQESAANAASMQSADEEQCEICGQIFFDSHACLQSVPSSLLTLHDPRLGSVVADHYVLEEYICTSDTSFVYKARHQLLNTHVCIKITNGISQPDPFSLLRTSRAALVAVRLDHPNIARTICFSHQPGDTAALVMEWAQGAPLTHIIARDVTLTPLRAVTILEALCDGLRHAQAQGVNHINLKPSAVMITEHNGVEQARLLDFGIMKMLGPHTFETQMRSPQINFASPEERTGQPPDQRSMIFSLGMILLHMLTGRVDELQLKSSDSQALDIPPLVKTCPDMKESHVLDNILTRCLAEKPSRRFKTINELSFALSDAKVELERISNAEKRRIESSERARSLRIQPWMVLIVVATILAMYFAWHNLLPVR